MKTTFERLSTVLVVLLSFSVFSYAQTALPLQSFPSPNAASLGLFTEFPVSHFTGIPDIKIPLCEITEGPVKVPVTLNYHPAAVRVHSRPGWVGLGWNLQAGGAITRTVHGKIDEYVRKQNVAYRNSGFYSTYSLLDGSDTEWCNSERLTLYRDHYVYNSTTRFEVMPDEFSFNFLGYSGKFFLGHDGQWKVVSDQDIKVVFENIQGIGHIGEQELPDVVKSRINHWYSFTYSFSAAYFNKFTLITPDGVKFEFGGTNAVEYAVHFRNQQESYPLATTFHLSKIIVPTGQEINFNYERGDLVETLSTSYIYSNLYRTANGWFGADCGSGNGASDW